MEQTAPVSPPILFESKTVRRYILASYWVVIILALPLWWTTTSIERQSLPTSDVLSRQSKELVFPVHVDIDAGNSKLDSTVLARGVQSYLDGNSDVQRSQLQIYVSTLHSTPGAYQVSLQSAVQDSTAEERQLMFSAHLDGEIQTTTDLAMGLADALATLLAPYTTLRTAHSDRAVTFAPRYRLAFTLLNEDAASENAVLSWDVANSLSKHLSPVLDRLSVLHNFTVESQVQYHAPLAFEPHTLYKGAAVEYGLTQEDLTVFVNSAEWTLSSSVSSDPVLHFVLFVPSSRHSPLRILGTDGIPATSSSFILPQWGGIVLFNPPTINVTRHLPTAALDSVFVTFRHQLTSLLGVPALPAQVHVETRAATSAGITDWQLDALLRRRAIENVGGAQETLQSIVRLVAQIENMPVGQDVKGDVQDALTALDEVYAAVPFSLEVALKHAGRALTLASRAFFNPGMLALLYFPAEHKYAVYTPLFASIAAPLVVAVLREVIAERKAAAENRHTRLKAE
ncbi:hypothetical protein WOLCODRAFT_139716 [Wolfiporia cocos MD-104 SS10]|uniref:GPI transamidase component PIG-S n=1 Tax=Wolfiporia cocos (strain MD-104) TaxID=742152 RepID=A0A2H3J8J7_WOLCO|nr:hypothetical protein WOLCODRAFT_139716 [Wolfiporia cocos MD-104 SS10]